MKEIYLTLAVILFVYGCYDRLSDKIDEMNIEHTCQHTEK